MMRVRAQRRPPGCSTSAFAPDVVLPHGRPGRAPRPRPASPPASHATSKTASPRRPLRVIPGEHVAIAELLLDSPPEQPLHCPPAVTQLHFHDAGRTHRLISHYARRR